MADIAEFSQRLTHDWLIPFCTARGYSHEGYDGRGISKLNASDAIDFIQSIDCGLVAHRNGFFTAPQSKAKEQIFWQGDKQSVPRKVTLWLEPIITIGALRKLQRDFHWEGELLGLQSKTWAFDLVGYSSTDLSAEHLVCEVKKSAREIDSLIDFMLKHLNSPSDIEHNLKSAERNAFKKVLALRASKSEVFWALGPNRYGYVFKIIRGPDSSVQLLPSDETALLAPD